MKAILEFALPDDQDAYDLAHAASRWQSALLDILELLRHYQDRPDVDNATVDKIRLEAYEILNAWNLNEE